MSATVYSRSRHFQTSLCREVNSAAAAATNSSLCSSRRAHFISAVSAPSRPRCGKLQTRTGSRISFSAASPCRLYSSKANSPLRSDKVLKKGEVAPSFAFAFDIDGVLLHVAKPIPGATEALRFLQANDVPFILLTNGGGKRESDRVAELSRQLDVPLTTDNFVQSHTPFRVLAEGDGAGSLRDKTVLVMGSHAHKGREIAEGYGFRNVIIPADILMADRKIWPFDPLLESVYKSTARPLPKPLSSPSSPDPAACLKIDAVFVFNDPRDWALDIQLIIDLLLSRQGYLGTYSEKNKEKKWQGDGQPTIYFSNADLEWSARWHINRLGQGAFQAAVRGVWDKITNGGPELKGTVIGKPHAETYQFAEGVLETFRGELLQGKGVATASPLRSVYMVGDNPASDIAGANTFNGRSRSGAEWLSLLVRTGVWNPSRTKELEHEPTAIVDDVYEAVRWALEREAAKKTV